MTWCSVPVLLCFLSFTEQAAALRSVAERESEEQPVACQDGNTEEPGCKSVCRWLKMTNSTENGHCEDFREMLKMVGRDPSDYDAERKKLGTYKEKPRWKFWGHESSMEPILKVLSTNCQKQELEFYAAALWKLLEFIREERHKKYMKYEEALEELQEHMAEVVKAKVERLEEADDSIPLEFCSDDMHVQEGDILTFEVGGPNFQEISGMISEAWWDAEALRLKRHCSYGLHFEHGKKPFDTDTEEVWANRTKSSKAKRIMELAWKHTANGAVKAGKAVGEVVVNGGKLLWDVTLNVAKIIGSILVGIPTWTGAGLTRLYSKVTQETPHTNSTRWTHTELGVGVDETMSAYSDAGVAGPSPLCRRDGQIVVSRFVGDGTVDASAYQHLAASRALMWQPFLEHYSATVGEWYRVVAGRCTPLFGPPEKQDYFEAVTQEKVAQMWDYEPTEEENEKGFYQGIKDSFRTHDEDQRRVKPKAMFCSKFTAAVWTSTIGNPTEVPDASPRARDLKKMFPVSPGACSPWALVRWILSPAGRKSWKSCIAKDQFSFDQRCKDGKY